MCALRGWHSPREINLFAEAMRRGFAVRNGLLGDPDFISIPMSRLLSQQFADSLSKIDRGRSRIRHRRVFALAVALR